MQDARTPKDAPREFAPQHTDGTVQGECDHFYRTHPLPKRDNVSRRDEVEKQRRVKRDLVSKASGVRLTAALTLRNAHGDVLF